MAGPRSRELTSLKHKSEVERMIRNRVRLSNLKVYPPPLHASSRKTLQMGTTSSNVVCIYGLMTVMGELETRVASFNGKDISLL